MASDSHFRGHLFADLRGSTAYTQRAGNAAGAELVQRFRQMIRDEVGSHEGAEVKTEGDSIYVVFPSASMALLCGLALVEKAESESAENPDKPIHMGVGIHAGEAVRVPEGGYIGTAVNLAARVCAIAAAGEVLVTGTVREIAQGSVPVTFVPRGRKRLKGIGEEVDLWRVLPEGATVPRTRRIDPRVAIGAAAVLLLAVVGGGAFALVGGGAPPPTPTPVPEPTAQPARIGSLLVGDYATTVFSPPFAFGIRDAGWTFAAERTSYTEFRFESDPQGRLAIMRITGVHDNPCVPGGYSVDVGSTPESLMETLRSMPFLETQDPTEVEIDGNAGLSMNFTISESVFAACDVPAEVSLFPLGTGSLGAATTDAIRVQAVQVGDRTVSAVMITDSLDVPVNTIEAYFGLAQKIVDSVEF